MDKVRKIELLADLLDVESEVLSAETNLSELDEWDSLARLSLIVMVEDECGKSLSGEEVRGFKTIGDILDYMG